MRVTLFWILAVAITFGAIVYQRATGPTYPKKIEETVAGKKYSFKLTRSHGGESDCKIELTVPDQEITGSLSYRRYPTREEWTTIQLERQYDNLTGFLPHQPPAGKLEYKIELQKNNESVKLNLGNPVVIRFKGDVPASVLIPHVFFMFFAMLLSNLAGVMALFRHKRFRFYGKIALAALFLGGLILGPWVQWYAFGEAWAGVPFAWDLTDNKTLIAFIFWVLAYIMNRKTEKPVYTIIASVVMLLVYSIPHSMFGSQLDPETGKVIQGFIHLAVGF